MRSHYIRQFIYRLLLLAAGLALYFTDTQLLIPGDPHMTGRIFRIILWASICYDAVRKFFPSKNMSMGCRKVLSSTYRERPHSGDTIRINRRFADRRALMIAFSWVLFNLIFFLLHRKGFLHVPELMLLVLLYFLSDMICVLFFCPFRLMLSTKCCVTCRIFNWDSMMLCTPFFIIGGIYGWSLIIFAFAVLAFWEISYIRHPQRFFEASNASLSCASCRASLCGRGSAGSSKFSI